jgi:hypothetical protein
MPSDVSRALSEGLGKKSNAFDRDWQYRSSGGAVTNLEVTPVSGWARL